jgi:NAD(P)-dependent dehydrogenase (short-subunit alcohol dehydrogenase family)
VSAAAGSLTCVVTGATSGIGREVAGLLTERGAAVIGIGRDAARCREAEEALGRGLERGSVRFLTADLSSLPDVRRAAGEIRRLVPRVDVLVNNAGTFTFRRRETAEGVELQLAVNWLAAYALTGMLLPRLLAAPRARVVTVSSGSHFAGRMHWNDLHLHRGYNGLKAYDQSKLATVLFSAELARRLGPRATVSTYAVDPGLVSTEIGKKAGSGLAGLVWQVRARNGITPRAAAESVCSCALEGAVAGATGLYWKEGKAVEASARAGDLLDAMKLWETGELLSGVAYP